MGQEGCTQQVASEMVLETGIHSPAGKGGGGKQELGQGGRNPKRGFLRNGQGPLINPRDKEITAPLTPCVHARLGVHFWLSAHGHRLDHGSVPFGPVPKAFYSDGVRPRFPPLPLPCAATNTGCFMLRFQMTQFYKSASFGLCITLLIAIHRWPLSYYVGRVEVTT